MLGIARGFVLAGAISLTCLFAVTGVSAQQSQPLSVTAFLADPAQLLKQNPDGGLKLSEAVQQLALADPSAFKALIGLVPSASDLQKSAIGTGLAQATKIKVLTDQTLAADWQQQIAAINDPPFKIAATDAFGDVKIGATGSPLGGTGVGPLNGPPAPTSSGPAQTIPSSSAATSSFTMSSSVSSAAGPASRAVSQ